MSYVTAALRTALRMGHCGKLLAAERVDYGRMLAVAVTILRRNRLHRTGFRVRRGRIRDPHPRVIGRDIARKLKGRR